VLTGVVFSHLLNSVVDPDPVGSKIICKLGSRSVINFGSGSKPSYVPTNKYKAVKLYRFKTISFCSKFRRSAVQIWGGEFFEPRGKKVPVNANVFFINNPDPKLMLRPNPNPKLMLKPDPNPNPDPKKISDPQHCF
jgi:hypothetical protein